MDHCALEEYGLAIDDRVESKNTPRFYDSGIRYDKESIPRFGIKHIHPSMDFKIYEELYRSLQEATGDDAYREEHRKLKVSAMKGGLERMREFLQP